MASFADSVIKDQKEQIRAEDDKMMKHIENQLKKHLSDKEIINKLINFTSGEGEEIITQNRKKVLI